MRPLRSSTCFLRKILRASRRPVLTIGLGISLTVLAGDPLLGSDALFVRGDLDGRTGVSLGDAVAVLGYSTRTSAALSCEDAADANDDGRVDLADGVYLLDYLYRGGAHPPLPFSGCGPDPSDDSLSCASSGCEQDPRLLDARLERDGVRRHLTAVDLRDVAPRERLDDREADRVESNLSSRRSTTTLPRRARAAGLAAGETTVELGDIAHGEIVSARQADVYRFEARPGQWVTADRLAASEVTGLNWKIEDRWGRVVASDFSRLDDLGPVALLGGSYTLTVLPEGSGTGTYSFRVVDATPDTARPLEFDETVAGNIDPDHPGQRDVYTFTALAGERVFLDLISTESAFIHWKIEDELGREVVPLRRLADFGPLALMGGDYRLTVEGSVLGGDLVTGSYEFAVLPLPEPVVTPIVLGEVVSGELTAPGQTHGYELSDLPAGQAIFLDVLSSSSSQRLGWEVRDEVGRAVLAQTQTLSDTGPIPLAGGDYEVRIVSEGDGPHSYECRVTDATPLVVESVAIGDEIAGEIPADRPGVSRAYEFSATPGHSITLELIEASNRSLLGWEIEDVHGRAVLERTSDILTRGPIHLAGGSYRLLVSGDGGFTGDYRFLIRDDGSASFTPTGTGVTIGEEVVAAVTTPGGELRYTFEAAAGERFFVDLLEADVDLDWELLDPVGRSIESQRASSTDASDLGPHRLTAGTYSLVLTSRSQTATPAIRFRVMEAAIVTTDAAVGDVLSGSFLDAAGSEHHVRFALAATTSIFFDRTTTSFRLRWTLLDPAGGEAFSLSRSNEGPIDLAAGAYTLVLDPEFGHEPDYEVAIRAVEDTTTPISFDEIHAGSFEGRAGSTARYLLDLAEDTRVFFDRLNETTRLEWSLHDPVGQAVFGPVLANDAVRADEGPYDLAAGVYTLVLDPQEGHEPLYDFRAIEVLDGSVDLAFGAPTEAGVSAAGTTTYEFTASEGQRYTIDLHTVDPDLRWSLIDELDEAVFRDERTIDPDVDLGPWNLAAGTYRLVVGATEANTPSYGFTAWQVAVDLVVEDLFVDDRVVFAGDDTRDVTVSWSAGNLGGGPGPAAPAVDRILISTDAVAGNEDDIPLGDFLRFETVAPHSSYSRTETVRLPSDLPLGLYQLFVVIDANGALEEPGGETNNVGSVDIQVVEDLPPVEPGFIATTSFPFEFTASGAGQRVDVPLSRPVALDSIRYVHAEAIRLDLDGPEDGAATAVTLVLMSGRDEVLEVSIEDVGSGSGAGVFVLRFSSRLAPETLALLPLRSVDGIRFRFDQDPGVTTTIAPTHEDGRLRVYFAGCEFAPCGPHVERRAPGADGVTFVGGGPSSWETVVFDESVPGDGLRFISGPRFSATVSRRRTIVASASSEVQLILDNGALVTMDDSRSPSTLEVPDLYTLCASHSLGLVDSDLAGRRVVGFQWRVHTFSAGLGQATAIFDPLEDFAVRFLYDVETCHGDIAIPPVEISPADGSAFAPGSSVTLSGRTLAPEAGRPVSAVLVNGEPVDSLDAAGRFFKTVEIDEGDNLFVVQVVEPGCGEFETLVKLVGLTDGTSGLDGYAEVSSQLAVEYAETTFVRGAEALVVKARVRNVSEHPVRAPILMVLRSLAPPSVEARAAGGLTDDGEPYVVLLSEGTLAAGEVGPWVSMPFSNPGREPVRFDVRWLAPEARAPYFDTAPETTAVVGTEYRYAAAATDPDGDPLHFELDLAPGGMSVDRDTGLVKWSTGSGDLGAHDVSLSVLDELGGRATQRWTLTVAESTPNRPPFFTSIPVTTAAVAGTYLYTAQAADPDGDDVIYALLSGPEALRIDSATGEIEWNLALAGEHPVSVEASDAAGGLAVQAYVLSVGTQPSNPSAPRITTSPLTAATVGVLYVYQPVASDPDGDVIEFALDTGPQGMTVESERGRVEWTPSNADAGIHPVTLVARDGRGGETRQGFEVVVAGSSSSNRPPVVESVPGTFAVAGELYSYDVEAIDPERGSIEYRLPTGPAGMSIDQASGLIEWTPGPADEGTHPVSVRAVDAAGAAGNQAFRIHVRASNAAPRITSPPPADSVLAGTVFQYDLDGEDDDGDLLRHEIVSAPASATVQPITGLFTWEATPADVGLHPVTLRVVDCCGGVAELAFRIEVVPDTEPPEVAIGFDPNPAEVGGLVRVQVGATDNAKVVTRTLTVECAPDPPRDVRLDEIGRANFSSPRTGYCVFTATVTDPSGNENVATSTLQVGQPDHPIDPHPPVVEVHSPAPGAVITSVADVVATISDATPDGKPGSEVATWSIEMARAGSESFNVLAVGAGETAASVIATIDAPLLPNGAYRLRIVASDTVQTGGVEFEVHVAGKLKLANFTLEFGDLFVPLAGIPIAVTRRYDSLDTSVGDFGAGWTLGLPGRVEDTALESETGNALVDLLGSEPFGFGTRVYVTLADGRRVGFTFEPRSAGGLRSMFFFAHFRPDPGVDETLEVAGPNAPFFMVAGRATQVGVPYNPTKYRVTTREGVEYTIDESQGLEQVEDRSGNVIRVGPDGLVSSLGPSVAFRRDALGRIVEITDPAGGRLSYAYDDRGDLVSVTDQTGRATSYVYLETPAHYLNEVFDPRGSLNVRADYDAEGRLIALTDGLGNVRSVDTDLGRRLETVTDASGNTSAVVYDAHGNIVQWTNPLGATETAEYDADDRRISYTDPRGSTTRATYDARGNMTSVTDALGNVTRATYDESNRVTSVVDPTGGAFEFEYDAAGNLVSVRDPLGRTEISAYDAHGRQVSRTDPLGNETRFAYGPFAAPERIIRPNGTERRFEYDNLGAVTRIVDENGGETTFDYDGAGRLIATRDAEGHETVLTYDGQLLASISDPLGRVTRYEYNVAGRRTREIQPSGGVVEFTYDGEGRLLSRTDPLRRTTSFEYRADGRMQSVMDAAGGVRRFEHDEAGNRVAVIDENGHRTTFAYDALNRLKRETDPLGGVRTFEYNALGRPTTITDANGNATHFTYDGAQRVIQEINGLGEVTAHTHDANGNRTSTTRPDGVTTRQSFDALGRVVEQEGPTGAVRSFTYDNVGSLLSVTDEEGQTTAFAHDGLGRMTWITTPAGNSIEFTYDAVGNRVAAVDALGRRRAAGYDELNRRTRRAG